jgi:tetratricopeptide (TPR) repeat protein
MVRSCAIEILVMQWHITTDNASVTRILDLAVSDSDVDVRMSAITKLASLFKKTDNVDLGNTLAKIILNDSEDSTIREAAYRGLLQVKGISGLSRRWIEKTEHNDPRVNFPEDVDWELVNSFLDENRTASPLEPISSLVQPSKHRDAFLAIMAAQRYLDNSRPAEAIQKLDEAIRLEPRLDHAHYLRAIATGKLGRLREALEDFNIAIDRNESTAQLYLERGAIYEQMGKLELAGRDYATAKSLEVNPLKPPRVIER